MLKTVVTALQMGQRVMDNYNTDTAERGTRRHWQSPELSSLGTVAEILQGGGGKLSPTEGDPGDLRKPSGQA